ncbi:MAG: hypothetical protein GY847_18630 [Proteobacteria bacterium]|nr:hypothetical protein [Pseudomonadota bacterium]
MISFVSFSASFIVLPFSYTSTFSLYELCEKLAALVPPPRKNLVRYHGCLAPHAKNRDKIVPKKQDEEEPRRTRGKSPNRLLWAA